MTKDDSKRLVDMIMAAGDEVARKARSEQERSVALRRAGDAWKADLAHDHAWALRKEAEGYWGAAHLLRRDYLDSHDHRAGGSE